MAATSAGPGPATSRWPIIVAGTSTRSADRTGRGEVGERGEPGARRVDRLASDPATSPEVASGVSRRVRRRARPRPRRPAPRGAPRRAARSAGRPGRTCSSRRSCRACLMADVIRPSARVHGCVAPPASTSTTSADAIARCDRGDTTVDRRCGARLVGAERERAGGDQVDQSVGVGDRDAARLIGGVATAARPDVRSAQAGVVEGAAERADPAVRPPAPRLLAVVASPPARPLRGWRRRTPGRRPAPASAA